MLIKKGVYLVITFLEKLFLFCFCFVFNIEIFFNLNIILTGGEPARIHLFEYEEAITDAWIDKQHLHELSESDKMPVGSLKITYMTGKGNNHLVLLLFPPDTIPALRMLAAPMIRGQANVLANNIYLFAISLTIW